MSSPSPRRRGAPPGNFNALKHGFYTRRLKKHDLTGVESIDVSGLIEEIALIRVFTRRLFESCEPEADAFELAEILRILCLASSTITRVVKTQYLLSVSGTGMGDEIDEAIRQINAELRNKLPPAGGPNLGPPTPAPRDVTSPAFPSAGVPIAGIGGPSLGSPAPNSCSGSPALGADLPDQGSRDLTPPAFPPAGVPPAVTSDDGISPQPLASDGS